MSPQEHRYIRIWTWDDAPEEYRRLSAETEAPGWLRYYLGAEEWIAHIPAALVEDTPRFLGSGMSAGPYSDETIPIEIHVLDDGSLIIIGADPYPAARRD